MSAASVSARRGVRRILTWPVGPRLIVGRFALAEPMPRAAEVIDRAALPAPIASLIAAVVQRTGLWHREQADVARELVAHFSDALEAGTPVDDAVRAFGDPQRAGRLIRRAKRRARGPVWHAWVRAWQTVALLVLVAAAAYVMLAVRLHGASPTISRDYAAELSAPALAVPAAERAWPLYREAYLSLDRLPNGLWKHSRPGNFTQPGDEHWPELLAFLEAHQEALSLTRRAAERAQLGYAIANAPDIEVHVSQMLKRGADPEHAKSYAEHLEREERRLFRPQWDLDVLRTLERLLIADAWAALEAGDGPRLVNNVRAIVGVAEHYRELPAMFGDQLAFGAIISTANVLGDALHERPDLLGDGDLRSLAHILGGFGGTERLRIDLSGERAMMMDFIQHVYSDDGRGNGRLTAEGIEWLARFLDRTQEDVDLLTRMVHRPSMHPILAARAADRRESEREAERLLAAMEAEINAPPWEWSPTLGVHMLLEDNYQQWRVKYPAVAITAPAVNVFAERAEHARLRRDATLVAVSLELHRRVHGGYPGSLEELTPSFLPRMPVDPFDGGPVKYRLVDGQPLVYVVGADRKDDGGAAPAEDVMERELQMYGRPRSLTGLLVGSEGAMKGDWHLWPRRQP